MTPASPVTLRRLRWWDVPAVLRMEHDLFADDPWSAEQWWSELAGVPATRAYLLAEAAGTVVGYAGLWLHGDGADVQTVAVSRARQRRGTGGLLVSALLQEAARRGVREVLLEVRADNAPALALYRRHGFERVGVRRGYYAGGRVDALVLRRRDPAGAIIGR